MVGYQVILAKQAQKDAPKIAQAGLKPNALKLFEVLSQDPYQNPPPYKKLKGYREAVYSRRLNIKHRLVYTVNDQERYVKVLAMWTHYDQI